jgi:hypothetical protein
MVTPAKAGDSPSRHTNRIATVLLAFDWNDLETGSLSKLSPQSGLSAQSG